jgi:hypothetical protein
MRKKKTTVAKLRIRLLLASHQFADQVKPERGAGTRNRSCLPSLAFPPFRSQKKHLQLVGVRFLLRAQRKARVAALVLSLVS